MSQKSRSNVDGGVRAKICQIGWQMELENPKYKNKMNITQLAKRANVSPPTARLWWNRRDELLGTGSLLQKPRTGRPPHSSFSTPQKTRKSLEIVENLPEGKHLDDAAKKLKCCKRTVQRHAKKSGGVWKFWDQMFQTRRKSPLQEKTGQTPCAQECQRP